MEILGLNSLASQVFRIRHPGGQAGINRNQQQPFIFFLTGREKGQPGIVMYGCFADSVSFGVLLRQLFFYQRVFGLMDGIRAVERNISIIFSN